MLIFYCDELDEIMVYEGNLQTISNDQTVVRHQFGHSKDLTPYFGPVDSSSDVLISHDWVFIGYC